MDTRRDDVLETVVRLAGAALALGDLPQAQAYVAEILAPLEGDGMLRASCVPFRMYLTCYRGLRASDDPRALAILSQAYRLLQGHAAQTPDEALRHSFLENVAENREIVAEFVRSHGQLRLVPCCLEGAGQVHDGLGFVVNLLSDEQHSYNRILSRKR